MTAALDGAELPDDLHWSYACAPVPHEADCWSKAAERLGISTLQASQEVQL